MVVQIPDLHPDSDKWYYLEIPQANLGTGIGIGSVSWIVPAELVNSFSYHSGLVVGAKLASATGKIGYRYPVVCRIITSDNQALNIECEVKISREGL